MVSIALVLLGLIIGSFLGALTYRLPRGISISKGRSFCPNCKKQIDWYDNIPLISFLLLKGHCRNCHHKISLREPLIEAVTAVVFFLVGLNPLLLFLSAILIAIAVIDLEHQIIPDELVFFGLAIFTIYNIQYPIYASNFLAGLISALILLSLNLITRGRGMGLGDVKLAILVGSMAGLQSFLIWLFFSFLFGAIIGIILIMLKKAKMKETIPFGPFLVMGYPIALFWGQSFLNLIGLK